MWSDMLRGQLKNLSEVESYFISHLHRAMWWTFGCQWRRIHHHTRLPAGVPTPPELSMGDHGTRTVPAYRPKLQPALWAGETGLQVSRKGSEATFSWRLIMKLYVEINYIFITIWWGRNGNKEEYIKADKSVFHTPKRRQGNHVYFLLYNE